MPYADYDAEPYVIVEKHSGGTGSFLIGVALGAGIALLLAPQSGRKTRRDIERRAREARDRAEEVAHDVSDRVSDRFARARSEVESRIDSAKSELDFRRQQVHSAVEAGRVAARDARAELERRIADTKAAYQAGVEEARGEPDDAVDDIATPELSVSSEIPRSPRRSSRGGGARGA